MVNLDSYPTIVVENRFRNWYSSSVGDWDFCCDLVAFRHGLPDLIFTPGDQASQPATPISLIIWITLHVHLLH